MGLDMYIEKYGKGKQVAYWRKVNSVHAFFERECAGEHGLDDCQRVRVTKEIIEKLLVCCNGVIKELSAPTAKKTQRTDEVLECNEGKIETVPTDISVFSGKAAAAAMEHLPPQEGFFFGTYEIDDWYLEDIKETAEICNKLLAETDFENEELWYHAWW